MRKLRAGAVSPEFGAEVQLGRVLLSLDTARLIEDSQSLGFDLVEIKMYSAVGGGATGGGEWRLAPSRKNRQGVY